VNLAGRMDLGELSAFPTNWSSARSRHVPVRGSLASWQRGAIQVLRLRDTLRSRGHPQRKTEARLAVKALNRMNELGRPISVRVA
jgi:hypothetical protein